VCLKNDGALAVVNGTRATITAIDPVVVPDPLATLTTDLADSGRRYVGVGSPATTRWLFPGLDPGRPLSATQLGVRLGKLGIDGRAGRRAAVVHLAAELPAAVLAELLGISNSTAANWVRDAGRDGHATPPTSSRNALTNTANRTTTPTITTDKAFDTFGTPPVTSLASATG
jgi:hypothetical protein